MLIDSGNKRISRKIMSADNSTTTDRNDVAPLKSNIQSNKNEVKYEYDGGFINPIFNSFNVAEIKHATPVKFEEVRELRKLPTENSIGRNISYNDRQSRSRIQQQQQRPRSYDRFDENLKSKKLSYEINDGEPVKWQVAKDLITPNWEQLKHDSEISRNFRYSFINDDNDDYENLRRKQQRSEPPPRARTNNIQIIDSRLSTRNDSQRVGLDASQLNNQGLYSQLPFGSMKRLTTFQNSDDDVKIIKKVIKDPDTDEILSVKSFIDYTTTVNISPSEKRKPDEKKSNNIQHNHEISAVQERKNSSASSTESFKPQSFPSPPSFGDESKAKEQPLYFDHDEPEKQNQIDEIYMNSNTSFSDNRVINNKPVSIKPTKSFSQRLNEKSQLPLNNLINELSKFRPDSLRPTPMGTSKKVEYNFTNDNQPSSSRLAPSKSSSIHSSPRLTPPPLKLITSDSELSPRVLKTGGITLPPENGLPDNLPQTDRGDWSAVMKTFDENIAGYTPKSPKSLNDSLANLKSEIEENEKLSDAQLF
jgi:hypothetical protein